MKEDSARNPLAQENAALDRPRPELETHVFRIRLWPEDLGYGQTEWRGQVRHLASGETRYFREWPVMVAFLEASLPVVPAQQ